MRPREQTISVGGIDVHAWTGGQGEPLMVLHGAGGNRGWTRWVEQVAQRFTVWAPTHPGFGRSGDAPWMESIDDLARFYLWFIDAAGLGRPHVLGHSIGGWVAAELATMSPRSIDRLVLVAPGGLKPERGEILDIFYHPPAEVRSRSVHDPTAIPEWDELFGRAPTAAELETAVRNQEMTARLTWKPYMHNPRLARFLPRVTNPALIVWGREDRVVPLDCGEQYRRLLGNATLSVLDKCGHRPPIEQPDTFARQAADPRQHLADRGQPGADGRAARHGGPDLGRPRTLRLRARDRRGDLVGELQSRPQSRALRGVPRLDSEGLDDTGPLPLGRSPLPFPARQPVVRAAAEAASAHLDTRHREPGDGGVGRPSRVHVRAVSRAVRRGARAIRLLPSGRRRGRPYGGPRRLRLPDLRRHRGHEGQGVGGRPSLRVAHGPDAARPRGVLLAGGDALAGRHAVRHAGAPAIARDHEL